MGEPGAKRKGSLLPEGASQPDRCSSKRSQISDSPLPSMDLRYSHPLAADATAHTQLRIQLWTAAYDCLERENAGLVDTYERILPLHFDGHAKVTAAIASRENVVKEMDPQERQQFLEDVIKTVFEGFKGGASTNQNSNHSKKNLKFVEQLINPITLAGRDVAFAWVGVSLALKFLLEPVTPKGFDREAAAFLTSRMNQYWDMSALLMDENRTGGFTKGSRETLKPMIVELYMHVLSYQMKIIYEYHQQHTNFFLQEIGPTSDWKDIRNDLLQNGAGIFAVAGLPTAWGITYHLETSGNSATSYEIKPRDMHLDNVPTVCAACGDLDLRIWGRGNYLTYVRDVQRASSECPACMIIIKGITEIVQPIDEAAHLELYTRKEASLMVTYSCEMLGVQSSRNLEFYTQPDYIRPWSAIGQGRSLRSGTCSKSMELVSEWFHRCLIEDRRCNVQDRALPTRVMYVGNESCEPHLYEAHGKEAPYTALSHCWGSVAAMDMITTTANLKDRLFSIPMTILPQTFADALLLTRELGIEYIWIDSLCIIQDDTEDWARESACMAAVYQNATLTISADGAADGSKGLFQTTQVPLIKEIPIPSQSSTSSGLIYARETTLELKSDYVHVIAEKNSEPLRQRGWALQEWLLSDRIVHFVRGELLWECKQRQFCQCQVISQSSTGFEGRDSRYVSKEDYYKTRYRDRSEGYLDWSMVVEDYTQRQLTIQADRLPALSGLAALNKSNAADDYIAGLWKSDMPEALLWSVDSDDSERYKDYYGPSWSWVAMNGVVSFHQMKMNNRFLLKCKVLELSAIPATHNPFGALKSSLVKIQGPVGILSPEIREQIGTRIGLGDKEETKYWGDLVLDVKGFASEVTSVDEIPFLIVREEFMIDHCIEGIALKRLRDEESKFMRVGYVCIKHYDMNWESWALNHFKVKKQVVTIV